jgi:hypothetical protein
MNGFCSPLNPPRGKFSSIVRFKIFNGLKMSKRKMLPTIKPLNQHSVLNFSFTENLKLPPWGIEGAVFQKTACSNK